MGDLSGLFSTRSPGGAWARLALGLAAGGVAASLLSAPLSGPPSLLLSHLTMVLASLGAAAACLGAREAAHPGARATWLLIAVGAVLASLGQAVAARAQLMDQYPTFPSVSFHLFIAFHIALAEGAILALRPAQEPRAAVEIALDGLLVVLAVCVTVVRFVLEVPLQEGWLLVPHAVAMVLGQFAIAASLFFVALLVLWRNTELSAPVVDGLLVASVLFAFGDFLVSLGIDRVPQAAPSPLGLLRLGGWSVLGLTALLAMVRPEAAPVTERRMVAARWFRQLSIPAAAVFVTVWALDAARRSQVTDLSMVLVGAMGCVLAVRIGAALFAVQREAEERRRAEAGAAMARIRAITAQMSPHFLFNALHSLSALARRDTERTERALERLGGLLRYGLDVGEQPVSLAAEWRFAMDYVELEKLRLGDRLTLDQHVDPDTLEASVPPLILQPLVENALKYSVNPFPEGGRVTVAARLSGDRLIIEVRDSGPGATSEQVRDASGVGLRGVRAQLRAHFGSDWSLETLRPPDGGFVVRIDMPAEDV